MVKLSPEGRRVLKVRLSEVLGVRRSLLHGGSDGVEPRQQSLDGDRDGEEVHSS